MDFKVDVEDNKLVVRIGDFLLMGNSKQIGAIVSERYQHGRGTVFYLAVLSGYHPNISSEEFESLKELCTCRYQLLVVTLPRNTIHSEADQV